MKQTYQQPEFQFEAYQMSYSNINGQEQQSERNIDFANKNGSYTGTVKTIENGKETVHKLTPQEIKDLLGHEVYCEAFLANGLPCPHEAKYLVEDKPQTKPSTYKSKSNKNSSTNRTKSTNSSRTQKPTQKPAQKGGFYCGYHCKK